MDHQTDTISRDEFRAFQYWKDPGLADRGLDRWDEIRQFGPSAFKTEAVYPGRSDISWWVLMRFDEAHAALNDPGLFSSRTWRHTEIGEELPDLLPLSLDPPIHADYRRLLVAKLTPSEVKKRLEAVRAFCRELVEEIAPKGRCDFVKEFAMRFPTGVFVQFMGLPIENLPYYQQLVNVVSHTPPDEENYEAKVNAAEAEILAMFAEVIDERQRNPQDDFISYLIGCEIGGEPISREASLNYCRLLLTGGLDTVVAQLGFNFLRLARDQDLRKALIADPAMIPATVEELVRFYGFAIIPRTLTRDVDFAGCAMKKGDRVIIPTAAANRDPAHCPGGERFDPARPRTRHVSFGDGPHVCPGQHLARAELRIAIEEWHRLIPEYRLASEEPNLVTNEFFASYRGFELEWPA